MEKSLLKHALSMGMDEACTIRQLAGGEPWSPRSRESSVPLEAWETVGGSGGGTLLFALLCKRMASDVESPSNSFFRLYPGETS